MRVRSRFTKEETPTHGRTDAHNNSINPEELRRPHFDLKGKSHIRSPKAQRQILL